jgi:hypothetical protein
MRDAADLQTLLAAVNAGHVTKLTFLRELKRRGVLADSVNVEEEAEAPKVDVPLGLIGREHDDEDHDHDDQRAGVLSHDGSEHRHERSGYTPRVRPRARRSDD